MATNFWDTDPGAWFGLFFDEYEAALTTGLYNIAQYFAPQIEAWMKANAVWTDRTGNARQTLYTEVEDLVTQISIWLGYGVTYGVFLELKNQGRYAIIGPALDYWARRVWNSVKALING